ncbi:gliding motility lipoprotein GldB [Galbibacter pacificus]|uniref:Gliding motility lipoprotein GldB n=1 Tax=Galbibacter pacificus TaxID=2996052 RepID=A0ABT6FML5_9FLAO|nr:gliding motility lipoprotein GldB [Galbibacter pacificus]MDG3581030.1 gliding motility lipoprotein GldB [Galbibacter pacificus]MDG3584508.1 gliding motility lipoprotein GldB [Galbibacter pacificus]
MNKILGLLIAILIISCSKENKLEQEIAKIEVHVRIDRFDEVFNNSSTKDLPKLKNKYPYLFPAEYNDSIWANRMNDTLQKELYAEIDKRFADFENDTAQFSSLFQHIKYYFTDFKPPKIVTVISDVDYKNRVIYADTLLLLGLDNYLGPDHKFYKGIQQYIRKNFEASKIPVDMAKTIAKSKVRPPQNRTFIAQMVYYGKIYYMVHLFLPNTAKEVQLGYTDEELKWAIADEGYIWRYFVERELLFSTDAKLQERFIHPAPFSKFYLELDNESPGRLGQYIGWQIVNAYMENNEVSLQHMLNASAEEIFNNSKYKPKK